MTLYVQLDVNYYHDDEFLQAGALGELLYIRSLCWCKANKTDGKIARAQLALFAHGIPKRCAQLLVDQKLWVETKNGWTVPAYLKRNKSKAEIETASELAREAGVRGAHERWHIPPEGSPSSKCPLCVGERMGSPHRGANGVAYPTPETETTPETKPETKPETEPIPEPYPLHPQDEITRGVPEPVDISGWAERRRVP